MGDLPKLYRVVYVKVDWIRDSDYGGLAHKQEGGTLSVKMRRVIGNDNRAVFVPVNDYDKDCSIVLSF